MRIAYFDCSSGISGDMFLGALIDAGLPLGAVEEAVSSLGIQGCEIHASREMKAGLAATSLKIISKEGGKARPWRDIKRLIEESSLRVRVKGLAVQIFSALAEAEGRLHGQAVEAVHFHELGAVDSIVDIVGGAVGLNHFAIEKAFSSPIKTGSGAVRSDHGELPLPAPATLELLRGAPIYGGDIPLELTTPTGAALIKTVVSEFGPIPPSRVLFIGYGAGSYDLESPNIFRLMIGEAEGDVIEADRADEVILVETNIDDLEPKLFGHIIDRLFAVGALDAWLTPIYMKKMRPAVALSAIVHKEKEEGLIRALFLETGSLGIRISPLSRKKAARKTVKVKTFYGEIGVKIGHFEGELMSVSPEYEDCREAALMGGVPIKDVYEEARGQARADLTGL